MKIINFLSILLLILGIFVLSCQEEKVMTHSPEIFDFQDINIPSAISTTSAKPVLLTAKITHPDGSTGLTQVMCEFTDSVGHSRLNLEMYDDGDALGNNSGDVIAFDQVFTVKIIGSQLMLPPGMYRVKINARDNIGEQKQSLTQSVDIFPNQAPEIVSYFFPDTVGLHMPATEVQFIVDDNDGVNDVLWVIIQGFEAGNTFPAFQDTIPNPQNNSPVFSMSIDSSYAVGKKDQYELRIFAEDRVSDQSSLINHQTYFVNTPPLLFETNVPDTLILPALGVDPVDTLITVKVQDGQSLSDIKEVHFFSLKPDSTYANDGNPFIMWDNGLPFLGDPGQLQYAGDKVAGDGVYSFTILLFSDAQVGKYIFTFYAEDYTNQLSTALIDSIIVTQN